MFEFFFNLFKSDIPYKSDIKKIRDKCYEEYRKAPINNGFLQPMERYVCSRCAGFVYRFLTSKGVVCRIVAYYLPLTDKRVVSGANRMHVVIWIYTPNNIRVLDPSTYPLEYYKSMPPSNWKILPDDCQPLKKDYDRVNGGIYG